MTSPTTYTHTIDHAPGERDLHAAEAACAQAGADRYIVVAPLPQLYGQPPTTGTYIAARGRVGSMARAAAAESRQRASDDASFWGGR